MAVPLRWNPFGEDYEFPLDKDELTVRPVGKAEDYQTPEAKWANTIMRAGAFSSVACIFNGARKGSFVFGAVLAGLYHFIPAIYNQSTFKYDFCDGVQNRADRDAGRL